MKRKIVQNCTNDEFEDVLFEPNLVVVQKEHTSKFTHLTSVYVYEKVGDKQPIYGVFREITEDGTTYWKEIY